MDREKAENTCEGRNMGAVVDWTRTVLARLIWDLQSFLSLLDSENLSYIAQAQKKSITELLSKVQGHDTPVEDAEYMIMSCPSSSPSNELLDAHCTEAVGASEPVSDGDGPAVPPHPPQALSEDDNDDTYEEAEPYITADITVSNTEKVESESSHYESYGEDDDEGEEPVKDRAHYIQWSASQPCLRPAPEPSRLCAYLWRRKWLGQWSKQLFIVRNHHLLCYKCARDLLPQLELNLRGCQLLYKSKSNKKIQHQLKVVPLGCEGLVLGYSSFQQADEWRTVMEEESVGGESQAASSQPPSCRTSTVQTDSEEERPAAPGFLNVLMNCQWQSLRCQVEAGLLNMFGQEPQGEVWGEVRGGLRGEVRGEGSPQYTVQLRGCEVRDGPHTDRAYRITLSVLGDQVAVLEMSSLEEKQRWLKQLQDCSHDDGRQPGGALSGLQIRRFPTSNTYMDDPPRPEQPIYCNTSILEHMLVGSRASLGCGSVTSGDSVTSGNAYFTRHDRKSPEAPRGVQRLELAGRWPVPLRAGSEINLASTAKQNKRTSFRQSLAVCSERAQFGFLNPLLRRTASAKTALTRAPSTLFIEQGKVFQRRKEWETKAAS